MIEASTVASYAAMVRPLFSTCSTSGIAASELMRFPLVQDKLASAFSPSSGATVVRLLHEAWLARDELGFTLLDGGALQQLVAALPKHIARQTPYIPPRIWLYQVGRLRQCLDEFLENQVSIEALFQHCIDCYVENYGSLSAALEPGRSTNLKPFASTSYRYHGSFEEAAERFGVADLLLRWVGRSDDGLLISKFSKYLGLVTFAGQRYLMNFSGMRKEEELTLRASCVIVENDPDFGEIYLLRGDTKKTVKDDNALWVTSPSAKVAVEAMTSVARLRMQCAVADPLLNITDDLVSNPFLVVRSFEPWCGLAADARNVDAALDTNYGAWAKRYPLLFDSEELRIRADDVSIARLVTPSLEPDEFEVGNVWPLADHQLRRTTAVNMSSSGLVSDPSLQYQLKHLTRAQALYYRKGFSRVPLNQKYQTEVVNAHYEVLALKLVQLFDDRYVSPLGESHKQKLLRPIGEKEGKRLIALSKAGQVPVRETLLG